MKKYYCNDCDKKVSDYRVTYCRQCADNRHSLRMKGKGNPAYRGIVYKCIDCKGKLSSKYAKRCSKCFHNYIIKSGIMKNKPKSKEWRKRISQTILKNNTTKGKNNGMFGKVTHGKWGKYKGINMRSSWEIKYAKFLDKHNYKWKYESKTFDLGDTTYTPDFYLPEKDMYIEVKGYWRDDAKKKFKRFKKEYPKENIKILDKNKLENMGVL